MSLHHISKLYPPPSVLNISDEKWKEIQEKVRIKLHLITPSIHMEFHDTYIKGTYHALLYDSTERKVSLILINDTSGEETHRKKEFTILIRSCI